MSDAADGVPPCAMVIYGGRGDLARRRLLPALVHLRDVGGLPEQFAVIGVGRREQDSEAYRDEMSRSLRELGRIDTDSEGWRWLAERMHYHAGDIGEPATHERLARALDDVRERHDTRGNVLFYLSTPPDLFGTAVEHLATAGLADEEEDRWRRVIVEKPFGSDLESAVALNRQLLDVLDEAQIYRIDHYLGKETVQNIMMLRFSNGIFEPVWNHSHVDHVQITVAETVGVEERAGFYDGVGALRDMVPNHLFQLLSLTAMEAPASFDADAVRQEKIKVLNAVHLLTCEQCSDDVVRGQYGPGSIDGERVAGYRDEPDVDASSSTETFVAMKLWIDTWRWAGVPFYLRTGKRLSARESRISVHFAQAPLALFRSLPEGDLVHNVLDLRLQPDEGVSLHFRVKVPGQDMRAEAVAMDFDYGEHFRMPPATGYETLLQDCMRGDATLFQRAEFIESGWRILQPVLDAWRQESGGPVTYPAGGSGPERADELMTRDGRRWDSIGERA